jgi:hypothetical protein
MDNWIVLVISMVAGFRGLTFDIVSVPTEPASEEEAAAFPMRCHPTFLNLEFDQSCWEIQKGHSKCTPME